MSASPIIVLGVLFLATMVSSERTCKTVVPHPPEKRQSLRAQAEEYEKRERRAALSLTVPVKFHVIHQANNVGKLPQTAIDAQIAVMNGAYSGVSMTFVLSSVQYIQNDNFFTNCDASDTTFKTKYTVDPTRYLNVFTCGGSGYLGWSPLPGDYQESSPQNAIVLAYDSLPGQGNVGYDEGDTLVHEAGHYFGLYHTFSEQNQCSETSGDGVADTPMEKSAAYGCPTGRDSCPSAAGVDPIWSYMDYTDDACMYMFSPGQIARIQSMTSLHRSKFVANTQSSTATSTTTTQPSTTTSTTTKAPTTAASTASSSVSSSAATTTTSTTKPTTSAAATTATTSSSSSSSTTDGSLLSEWSCWDLGWPVSGAGSVVCGATKLYGYCPGKTKSQTYAESMCTDYGARLCTADEFKAKLTIPQKTNLKCSYQTTGVFWTSTPCAGGFITSNQGGKTQTCQSSFSSTARYIHCCADKY